MIRAFATRRFAALVDPSEICLLEYRPERGGVHVIGRWAEAGPFTDITDAADRLAVMISAHGTRRATVSVAINHFGAFQHVLSLPPASPDVLRPIVEREVQRTFGLSSVTFEFTIAGDPGEGPRLAHANMRRVSAIGAPTDVVAHLNDRLSASNIKVERITVIGQALSDAFHTLESKPGPVGLVVCTAGGPYVCFFLEGELALTLDVPPGQVDSTDDDQMVVDQVEQGAVYFRQQFRGARPERLLLACDPSRLTQLSAALRSATGIPVEPFGEDLGDGKALVAFGAAVGKMRPDSAELLGQLSVKDRTRARDAARASGLVTAAWSVAGAAVLFAAYSVHSLQRSRSELASLQTRINAVAPLLGPALQSARERAFHSAGAQMLSAIGNERAAIGRTLTGIESSLPDQIVLDSLTMTYREDGLRIVMRGIAYGTGAGSLREIVTFEKNLAAMVKARGVSTDFSDGGVDDDRRFTMAFVVDTEPR